MFLLVAEWLGFLSDSPVVLVLASVALLWLLGPEISRLVSPWLWPPLLGVPSVVASLWLPIRGGSFPASVDGLLGGILGGIPWLPIRGGSFPPSADFSEVFSAASLWLPIRGGSFPASADFLEVF